MGGNRASMSPLQPQSARTPPGHRGRRVLELAMGIGVVGALEVLDYITGPYASFSLLYLVPIAVLAWRVGRAPAIVVAVFAIACESATDWAWPQVTGIHVYVWNAATRTAVLVFGAVVVARIRNDRDVIRAANERLAEHLSASETRFSLLADTLTDHAIVLLSPAGRADDWSAAVATITGRSPRHIAGATLGELFPPADPDADAPELLARSESHVEEERWTLRADGRRYWADVNVYAAPERSGGKRLVVVRDATPRKEAEEEIRRARDEAVAVARELETFSYTVAHDLRAPLRAIDGFGAMLKEDCSAQLDERGAGYVARMQGAARRMGRLIDDLLEMSRLGRAALRPSHLDLTALAGATLEQLARAEPDRVVDVEVEEGLAAEGDPQLVAILLQNLIGNAWKFTSTRERARIEVGRSRTPHGEAFYVRDNGVGFDMAFVDRLFRPFERLHNIEDFEGTGIGLATVRLIVERHGGRAWAEGEVDRGATFSFTLPVPPVER
jgi:PAS domain S-box-containing protein